MQDMILARYEHWDASHTASL